MIKKIFLIALLTSMISATSWAASYTLPASDESVLGEVQARNSSYGDTISALMQRYDLGANELEDANREVDFSYALRANIPLRIPTSYILPDMPRKGIVVNIPEMRMYYYSDSGMVQTYPIGVGKMGRMIPMRNATVVRKAINPKWTPPESIRAFNREQGIILPKVMPAGPDNPLGPYGIYLSIPTYLIHSTIFPDSVGRRGSFGCIRMNERDIGELFPQVNKGTPVTIINEPVKAGWRGNNLYLEVHPVLDEDEKSPYNTLPGVVKVLQAAAKNNNVVINWQMVTYLEEERDGIPHIVGVRVG